MSGGKSILKKLLLQRGGKSRLLSAWITLLMGCLLLFAAIEIWSGFREILNGKNSQDSLGATFLTISKKVEESTMTQADARSVSEADIALLAKAPQVQDLGKLTPANFKVAASLGYGPMSFYTLLFLEAAPDRFLDQLPGQWEWKEGDRVLPIILSRDFLNMYNYIFAPSQGLPLLSEASVKALGFKLTMGEGPMQQEYIAQVEGFSDRISSVLVPQSFIDYGNKLFAPNNPVKISRLIVKAGDPSDAAFARFLESHHFNTNAEQLRFSKMRSIVQAVSGGTGVIAILLLLVSSMVFVLFIELTLARAETSVRLLLQIGYSPAKLSRFLARHYAPMILSAILLALSICTALKFVAVQQLKVLNLNLSPLPDFATWIACTLCLLLLSAQMLRSIRRALQQ